MSETGTLSTYWLGKGDSLSDQQAVLWQGMWASFIGDVAGDGHWCHSRTRRPSRPASKEASGEATRQPVAGQLTRVLLAETERRETAPRPVPGSREARGSRRGTPWFAVATFKCSRPQRRACHVPKDCLKTGPLDAKNVPEQPRCQRHCKDRNKALFKQRPNRNAITVHSQTGSPAVHSHGSAGHPPQAALAGTDTPAAHAARARAWAMQSRRFTAADHGLHGPGEPHRPRPGGH